jgi:hypothetical protein
MAAAMCVDEAVVVVVVVAAAVSLFSSYLAELGGLSSVSAFVGEVSSVISDSVLLLLSPPLLLLLICCC